MKNTLRRLCVAGFLVISANAQGTEPSWWMLCDTCVTDSDFQLEAMRAPSPFELVYVSSRQTVETRFFSRVSVTEDWGDGLQQLTTVTPLYLGAGDEAVFTAALNGASETEVVIERGSLEGMILGFGQSSSVAGDLLQNVMDARLLSSIREYLHRNGYLGDHQSVSGGIGGDIRGVSLTIGGSTTIRIIDLTITITYSDGSTLHLVRDGETGEYLQWQLTDANGDPIPMTPNQNGVGSIDPGFFLDRSFEFDIAHADDVIQLSTFITDETTGSCYTSTITLPDGTGIIRVTCTR